MIDSSRSGSMKSLWTLALIALIAAGALGIVQPATDASAQGTPAGGNFLIRDLATTANPRSLTNCGDTNVPPTSNTSGACHATGFLFNPGVGTISVVRTGSSAAGNATFTPTVFAIGAFSAFIDTTLPAAQTSACYQMVVTNGATTSRSDTDCIFFAVVDSNNTTTQIARGTVPTNFQAGLNGTTANFQWDAVPGAAKYALLELFVNGAVDTSATTPTSISLPVFSLATGLPNAASGFMCGVALVFDANGNFFGASNGLCVLSGTSSNLGSLATSTRTSTITGTPPTSTSTATAVNTATRTNTVPPTNTSTAGPTSTSTNTTVPTSTNTATATNTRTPAQLIITKTYVGAPNPVVPGQTINFIIQVTNIGQTDFVGAEVLDNLPAGFFAQGANDQTSPQNPPAFAPSITGNTVDFTGGTIHGGETRTLVISALVQNPCVVTSPVNNIAVLNPSQFPVNQAPSASTSVVITGCVQATLTPTPTRTSTVTSTISPTSTITLTPTITNTPTATSTPGVELAVVKIDSPDPVIGGNQLLYKLSITNNGPLSAGSVTVTDTVDNGFNFNCAAVAPGTQCNAADPNAANSVTILSASGDSGFGACPITVTPGTPSLGTPFAGQQSITCTGGTIGGNGGGATITVVVQTQAACTFILNQGIVDPTNSINDSNRGNNTAYAQTACGAGANTPTTLATFTPTRTTTSTPTSTATNTPTVTTIPSGGFTFTKTSSPNPVNVGQILNYTLTMGNTSGSDISNIALQDTLSTAVTFVGFTSNFGAVCAHLGANPGGVVDCGGGTIVNGNTNAQIVIVVAVGPDCTTVASPILNSATLASPVVTNKTATTSTTVPGCATITNTPTVTNTATVTSTITLTPTITNTPVATATPSFDLGVVKTFPAPTTRGAGQALNYTVTVSNAGPTTASNISLVDNSPAAGYTLAPGVPTGSNGFVCTVAASVINCNGGSITAGNTATIIINGTVTAAACGTTLINTVTILTDNQNSANDTAFASTQIICADLNVGFDDNLSAFGPDNSASGNWNSSSRYIVSNASTTTGITGITFNVTETNAASAGTSSVGSFTAAPTGGIGWTCVSNGFNGNIQAFWVCTGALSAAPGATSTVNLDFAMNGVPGATASSTVNWDNTVTCTNPTPCTSGAVSPANSDGSVLNLNAGNTPATDDPIVLTTDLDISPFVDNPGGETLVAGFPVISLARYQLFNDRASPMTGVTFSGSITGTASRTSVTASINDGTGGANAPTAWSCTVSLVNSWSCTGDLTADTQGGSGSNTPNGADTGNDVTITIQVLATGVVGQTIVYTPNAPTCGNPTPCTNNTVSPANADGGTTLYAPDTDTLTP